MRRETRSGGKVARLALAGLLAAAACGVAGGQTDPHGAPAKTVFRLALGEPTAIDPYNSQESGGVLITKNLYEGLLTIDSRTTELRPGVAVGNGPFKMKEPWRHDVGITLVRNDTYSGPKPALDEVRFHHPALPVPSRTPPP